jgi:hypothetical protein
VAERWGIYVDVEGFRSILGVDELRAVQSLGELMRAVFRIGRLCYPQSPDSITAHQFGDGFIVMSLFHEPCLDRCAAIAIAIMRHMAGNGGYARAAIVEGDLADIQGCYPEEVISCREEGHRISLRGGLMTITTVMGTALTRAVRLADAGTGPILLAGAGLVPRFDQARPWRPIPDNASAASLDWVHVDSDLVRSIQAKADLDSPSASELEDGLALYCAKNELKPEWKANVRDLLGVPAVGERAQQVHQPGAFTPCTTLGATSAQVMHQALGVLRGAHA